MKRRSFLNTLAASATGLAMTSYTGLSHSTPAKQRPNILLMMADDMGYSDIGCYGGEIHTPNLNQLAHQGIRFTQFYNCARCCPTRASLMTGLYPHQAGIGHMMDDKHQPGYRGDLNERCVTIAQVLKSAGYGTYMSGKWHVTRQVGEWSGDKSLMSKHNWPCQRGFDEFFGTIHGAGSYYNPISLTRNNTPIEPDSDNFYYTDAISDHASSFIEEHCKTQKENPFFCYVAFTSPHWPLHAFPEDIKRYKGRYDKGWDALREERYERMKKMGLIDPRWKLTERDPRVPAWEDAEDKAWQARRMEVFAAQVDHMDQGIGRIIETLKKQNQLDNTLIFFLADNGGCAEEVGPNWKGLHITQKTRSGEPVAVGNKNHSVMPGPENTYQSYGLPWANASNTPFRRYKHFVHEGGISTPLIVHWPAGIKNEDQFNKTPGHIVDIMRTCAEVSNADYPTTLNGNNIHPMEGRSLLPALHDEPLPDETIYFEHEGNRAIRQGKWKLVALGRKGKWELYDMEKDRSETDNLAAQNPDLVKKLAEQWETWAKRANVLPWPTK